MIVDGTPRRTFKDVVDAATIGWNGPPMDLVTAGTADGTWLRCRPTILLAGTGQGVHVVVVAADVDSVACHRRARGNGVGGGVGPVETDRA